jgi:type IV pilus assembly protein PilW
MHMMNPRATGRRPNSESGFSLVELMIAVTVGLMVLAGLVATFVSNSTARSEIERTNQQVENGRYAMDVLSDELRLAGFWADFNIAQAGLATPTTKPDPCATDLPTLNSVLPLHIQGYYNGATLTCLGDVRPNTDILVVRRVSTCVSGSANCATVAGAPYFQASLCSSATELGSSAASNYYRLDTNSANLDRHKKDCTTLANTRQLITRIYFVANNDMAGDGIPTLKRAELGAGSFSIASIAQGIENIRFEHGIDTNNDGIPDAMTADPDSYNACVGAACVTNWFNVTAVKINLLARTSSPAVNYTDTKTYALGLNSDGTVHTLGPFNDRYRRHVFQAEVRLTNPAGRRE